MGNVSVFLVISNMRVIVYHNHHIKISLMGLHFLYLRMIALENKILYLMEKIVFVRMAINRIIKGSVLQNVHMVTGKIINVLVAP